MTMKRTARRGLLGVLILLLAAPPSVLAQIPPASQPPPAGAPAPRTFSQAELDQLLAPIALYPDALVAQILMASTYPLEVVQADRWVRANPNIKGAQLEAAMQQQPWDPSVKSLTAFPQVLAMMDERLDWTQALGDAFLAQQQDVMATVQALRAKAYAAGYLRSTPQQAVVVQPGLIVIEPVSPAIVYVPIYDPFVVYGPWWYPAYPPFFWYPPGFVVGASVFTFGIGLAVGAFLWGGCDWRHHTVTIVNVNQFNTFSRTRITNVTAWYHDPVHRWGVPYRDPVVRQRFGQGAQPGAAAREAFRGRTLGTPDQPGRGGFERRPGGPDARTSRLPQGGFGPRQQLQEPPRQPEPQRPGRADPRASRVPQNGWQGPRQQLQEAPRPPAPQSPRPQLPGGGPSPPLGHMPQGQPGSRQSFQAPPPRAFEGLGRGGETRTFSDRGRMSRGGTELARPAPTAPPTAPGRGGPNGGGRGEHKGERK